MHYDGEAFGEEFGEVGGAWWEGGGKGRRGEREKIIVIIIPKNIIFPELA